MFLNKRHTHDETEQRYKNNPAPFHDEGGNAAATGRLFRGEFAESGHDIILGEGYAILAYETGNPVLCRCWKTSSRSKRNDVRKVHMRLPVSSPKLITMLKGYAIACVTCAELHIRPELNWGVCSRLFSTVGKCIIVPGKNLFL